jgi:thiol-disulfide isomerase/thioredoxin
MAGAARWKTGHKLGLIVGIAAALLAVPPLLKWLNPSTPSAMSLHASPRPLADLNFSDGLGRPTRLSAFRGRTVLLNVWATWCTPCREEMPTLDRLQATLGGRGFEVVGLSVDNDGLAAVQAFYQPLHIRHLTPYIDSAGEAMATLVATGIPLTLLIDAEGREIGRKLGPAVWDDAALVALLRSHIAGAATAHHPAAAASR